ncbi:MAG: hypothetical protein PHF51_01000 [Candidatus ainarchaeum sp.]|nr:hypothetical protein [Candidatus ainarchaeum sp.]
MNRRAFSQRGFCAAAKLFLLVLAASQTAAAMEITSCGVITQPGEHYLTHDITSSGGACLTITGSPGVLNGVTLDCRGYKLVSSRGGTGVILGQANGATIQNCGFEGFDTGIYLRFSYCDGYGGRPVVVAGQAITVRDNTISGSDTGIIVERSSTCSNGYVFEDTLWCGNMYPVDSCDVDFTGSNTATITGNTITAASCYSVRDPCDVNGFPKWCPPELFDPPNPYLCMYQGTAETCHSYDEMANYGNTCNGGTGSGAPPPPLGELEIPACGDEIKPVPVPQLPSEECTQLEVCNNAGDYKIEGDTTPIPYCTPAYSQPPDYSCACPGHCDCGESCLDCNIGYVPPAVNYANNELPIVEGQGRDYPGSDVDKGICWNKPIDAEINDTDVASFFYVDSGISKVGVWPTFIRYRDDTDILGNPIRLPDAYCANVTVCGQLTKPFRLTVTRWEPQPIDYSETNNPEVTPAQCGTSCFDGDDPETCPGCQCPVPKAYVCGKVAGSTTNVDYWAVESQAPVCDCSGDYCEGQIDSFMTDPDCDPGQGDICSYYTGPYDTACCYGTTYYSHYTIGFPDSPKNVIPADPEFQELCAYGGIPRGHEPCAPGYVCTPDVDFGEGSNSSLFLDYYVSYAKNARTPYVYRALDDFDRDSGIVDSEKLYNVTVNVSDIYHQWPYDVERVPLELLPGFATWSQAIFGGVPDPPYADARICTEMGNNASCPAYDIAPGGANPVEQNNYRDPRLNNFFRGQVKVKQVIEYFYNRKNESDLRNITVDGSPGGALRYLSPEECTVEGLRYNSTAPAPGLCPPPNRLSAWPCCEEDPAGTMLDEARCFCTWTFNDCDRGNHTFRLVAYEDIYVGDQVAAQDNAAGNLFPGIRRVNKIYNYFYVSGREEYNSSVNVTVRHNTTEMTMRVIIPPAAVASTATNFPGNVTVLNKYFDLDENYTKYAYIWAVPSDPVADGGAPYQFNVTYAKNKSRCEVFNLVDPLRTDFTCDHQKTEAMKSIQEQTGFPDTYCCNIENGTMAFNMSISRPGDFEVTATNQTFGQVGVQPATGYAAITITAEPKNITLTLPPKTLKNVEFAARAYVSDAAGKALKGYAYTVSIHFEDENHNTVGYAYARLPGGERSSSISCPVDPALGYCEFLVNATQNGILLVNGTCDGCDLASGENATLVLNTNCYDGTVNPPANKTEENVTVANPDGSEVLYYPDVNAVDAANNAAGDRLIGWDGQRMYGNDDVCAVGYSEIPVKWCVVDDPAAGELQGTGQFDGEAGILCVKGFTYTPQIDGEISDHLNFNGSDVSDDYMRATFRYPRIVWGWGVSAMGKNGNPLGSELDSLYAITPVYFNLSVELNANISLSSFNMTNDTVMPGSGSGPLNPFEIKGPSAMLTLDKEGYISRYDYPYDFSASGYPGKRFETYPQPGIDDVFRKNPQGMAEDKRGNFYVADSKGGSLYYFKLARQDSGNVIKLIGRVPEQGSLYANAERNTRTTSTGELADPFSVDYTGPYHPFGVAIDSYNRIFVVGLTEPDNVNCDPLGLTCGKVVIQILNPDWSVNTSYARNAPSIIGYSNFNPEQGSHYIRDRADIAVAGDGSEIYIVYGTDSLMMLRFDGEVISSFQNIPLYMPCRQLGSGCWDSNIAGSPPLNYGEGYCYWAAPAWMSGANQPTFSESVGGLKPLFLDSNLECGANNCDSSGICLNPYVEIGEGFVSFFSPAVKPFGEGKGVCVDDKYLFTPERDGPNTADDIIGQTAGLVSFRRYHQGVAVAYKDGYIFVVDRFTFERREGFGRPGLTQRCDWAKTGGCLGCTSVDLFAFTFRQLSYGEAIFGEGDAQGSASCNYCGDDKTKYKRTENWVRVYYEDEYGNVKPAMHLVIKKSVYTGDYSTISGEGFSAVTDALWGGMTASGTGLEEKGGMGWDFSVGGAFGIVEKLDITDDDNARVDGIDVYGGSGNYDIYLPVRDSEKTKPDWEGVWRVKVTGLQVSEDFKDVQGSVSAAKQLVGKITDPDLRGPTDVLVYEDVLRKNLPYGVYCEGCPDRAGIPMSVCRRQQAVAGSSIAAGRSASAGLSATIPNVTRKYFAQFYVDTVVEGAVNISYNGGKIWGIAHGVAPVLHALYEGGTFKLAFQTPYRSEKEACVRDSQCQSGAVCIGGACAPEVYPSLEYAAYSSRLFTKHFVALDNVNGSSKSLMVNSSFRYN